MHSFTLRPSHHPHLARFIETTVFLILLLVLSLSAAAQYDIATTYQINAAHTGAMNSFGLQLPFEKKWSLDLGQVVSYPIIANGRVYVTTTDNSSTTKRLLAIDQKTGAILWSQNITTTYYRLMPAYSEDPAGQSVFAVDTDARLWSFDAAGGSFRWRYQLPGQYSSSSAPTPFGGRLYIGASGTGGTLYCITPGISGATLNWSKPVANGDSSSPCVTSDAVFVSYTGPQVYRFRRSDGLQQWRYNSGTSGGGGATPALNPITNVLYTRSNWFAGMQRFDAATGALLAGEFPQGGLPAFDSGRMFHVDDSTRTLRAYDAATEAELWQSSAPAGERYGVSLAVSNNMVFVTSSQSGQAAFLYVIDATNGATLWRDQLPAVMYYPVEGDFSFNLQGIGVGEGLLVVPSGKFLTCYASTAYSLNISPSSGTVNADDWFGVSWQAPGGRPTTDWVGLYRVGTDDRQWLQYRYTNGSRSGSWSVRTLDPGEYEFRYYQNNGWTRVATSPKVTVNPLNVTLTASPSVGTANATAFAVDWTAPAGRPAADWIGLFKVGEPNTAYRWWQYTNGGTSGRFTVRSIPEPGEYEFRYLLRGGYQSVAASNRITVNGLDPSQFSLSATPSTVAAGGPLTVSWTSPPGRDQYDWIGLYRVGDTENRNYLWWRYTNGAESGSFNLTAPLTPGQYEFRYLLENGYTSIVSSNPVTVQ